MDSFCKLQDMISLCTIFPQLSGAEEAIKNNPVLYTNNVNEKNFGIKEDVVGLTLIESDTAMRMYMQSNTYFADECDVRKHDKRINVSPLQKYVWLELAELPLLNNGLVFAKNSTYAKAFSAIVAERLEMVIKVHDKETELPCKCHQHFFPVRGNQV